MRRARRGWVGLFLLLSLIFAACRQRDAATNTPPPTPDAAMETAQPAATVDEPVQAATATAEPEVGKPAKPTGEATAPAEGEEPEAAIDLALDDWTLMFYMSASQALDAAALALLNDLEAAGPTPGINIVVLLDRQGGVTGEEGWEGARRYLVVGDDGDAAIASQLEEELGPTNMGNPDSLTEFVAWAQGAYPANYYGLILWGESNGWRGLAVDSGDGDDLSMPDLDGALQRAGTEGDDRLDLVVLEGARTASVEALNAIAPYAQYAVAVAGTAPGAARDYEALLGALQAEAPVSPEQFARLVAAPGNDSAAGPLSGQAVALDLRQFAALNQALQRLSAYLVQSAELSAVTVAHARSSAEVAMLRAPGQPELHAAVDLGRFAAYLAQFAPVPELARHGTHVAEALDAVMLPSEGDGEERGMASITLAFLPSAQIDDPVYMAADAVGWQPALRAFYEARAELTQPSQGQMAIQGGENAGAQRPVLLGMEVRTSQLDGANLAVMQNGDEGQRRLFSLQPLAPGGAAGANAGVWPPGVTQLEIVWQATAPYLGDGANGDFVPLSPVSGSEALLFAPVQYDAASSEAGVEEAVVVLDGNTGRLHSMWRTGATEQTPQPIAVAPGDQIRLYNAYLGAQATVEYEPGATLVYTDGAEIRFDYYPLPSGDYQLGLLVEEPAGNLLLSPQPIAVNNDDLAPGYQVYFDAHNGFHFLYPLAWSPPVYDGRRVATAARQRGPLLTVSIHPESASVDAARLKAQALEMFGEVHILYEEAVVVDGRPGAFTAYGYNAEDGPHTGVFITFVDDETRTGYVVDVDGLVLDEESTLAEARQVVASWRFVPVRAGAWPEQWQKMQLGPLTVALPGAYAHESLENEWERFKDGEAFVALRRELLSGNGQPAIAAHWAEVASRGVDAFVAGNPRSHALDDSVWSRIDFTYEDDVGPVAGLILATVYGGEEIVVWIEAPAGDLDRLLSDQFLPSLAGLLAPAPGSAGVLVAESFDETGSWGAGDQDGATAGVREGVYALSIEAPRGFFWTAAGLALGNGEYEVEATQTAGTTDAAFGLLLGVGGEAQSFYLFEISADGYVWIGACQNACQEATALAGDGWFQTDAIHQGLGAANRLRVRAAESTWTFFINDVEVATVEDAPPLQGDVGLAAETFGGGEITVEFDNLRVISP